MIWSRGAIDEGFADDLVLLPVGLLALFRAVMHFSAPTTELEFLTIIGWTALAFSAPGTCDSLQFSIEVGPFFLLNLDALLVSNFDRTELFADPSRFESAFQSFRQLL